MKPQENSSESLRQAFFKSKFKSFKYENYFDVYAELFSDYRGKDFTFLEIGVANGGSLYMWRDFFGQSARIIGVDLNPEALSLECDGFKIYIGDQSSHIFWDRIKKEVGMVDIVLDDGGHTDEQQIKTLINCIPIVKDGGLLVVEDVHCSYQRSFGNPSKYSFVKFSARIIDSMNSRYGGLNYGLKNPLFSLGVYSVNFFESIISFRINRAKCLLNKPVSNNGEEIDAQDYRYQSSSLGFMIKMRENIIKNWIFYEQFRPILKKLNNYVFDGVILYCASKYNKLKLIKYFK